MDDTPYLDTQHLLAFRQAAEEYHSTRLFDPDRRWSALLYLSTLTSTLWEAVHPHLDYEADHADLDRAEGLTRGERLVLQVAANLFHGDGSIDLADLTDSLDDEVWEIVLHALNAYRDG